MNRFIKFGIGAALVAMVAWAGISRGGDQASGAGDFALNKTGDLYSLDARGAPLADVLTRLNELTGLSLEVDPKLGTTVTASLKDVELEKVLAAISGSRALVYEEQADKSYKLVEARLTSQQKEVEQPVAAAERAPAGSNDLAPGTLTNSKKPVGELRALDSRAILLQNAVIDTDAARQGSPLVVPPEFAAPADAEHQIVQFDHVVSEADRKQLADLGIEITHYVPNSAYAVRVTPEQLAELQNVHGVTYIEPYHPYFKMSRDILAVLTGVHDELATARVSAGEFNALSFRGSEVADAIVAAGGEIVNRQAVDGRENVTFRLASEKIPAILALSNVQWLEPDVRPKALNDLASQRVGARSLRQLHPTLTGAGVTIGVTDSGIDYLHRVFALDPNNPTSTNLNTRIAAYYTRSGGPTSDGVPGDNNGHGTHVAGTIIGNGALSDTVLKAPGSGTAPFAPNKFAGVAPAAKVVMIEDFNSFSDAEQAGLTLSSGARISNNSWGNSVYEYGTMSAIWDALVLDANTNAAGRQPLIAFFAAGNDGAGNNDGTGGTPGTIGQPGNAKNVITIGSVEQRRKAQNLENANEETDSDWQISYFSSRGPVTTSDIRAKPDLVAPGSYVLSAQSRDTMPDELIDPFSPNRDYRYDNLNSGTNYAFFSGTSMATPVAAGAGALFYQYYTNSFGVDPSPAMMKAALVAGARSVNSLVYSMPRANSPSNAIAQGFGMIDVKRSVDGPAYRPTDYIQYFDEAQTGALGTDDIYTHEVTLNGNEGGLKIVIAWSDAPGTPGNAIQLVNDLNLVVIPPGGGAYQGNQFSYDGISSHKFTAIDPNYRDGYNNVETVIISDAPVGKYTIQVRGYSVTSAEKQPFALVVMKGIGIEGRTQGESVAMALDTNSKPVIAYAAYDAAGQKQIYVKRWVGPYGDFSELGNWWRLDSQWAGYRHSAVLTGISRTLEDSETPSIAVDGENVFVAWRERPRDIGGTNVSRVFVRQWDGSDWIQLGGSAQDFGVPNSTSYNTFSPQIAVMGNGRPVVAWLQYSDTTTNLIHPRVAVWDGSSWVGLANSHSNGLAMTATNSQNEAEYLSLTINKQGNPVVAWKEARINNSISVRQWNGSSWQSLNFSNSLFYIHAPKITAAKNSDDLYLVWRQQVSSPFPYAAEQIFAARRSGGSWSAMGNSMTHPAISAVTNGQNAVYPFEPSISVGEVQGMTNVYVSWRAGNSNGNFVLVKQWRPGQATWSSAYNAGDAPGIDIWPDKASAPVSVADRFGLPIVSFPLSDGINSAIATYTVIADRDPPIFAGLQSAIGGTNGNVALTWLPAVDDISTTIYYRIYRSPAGVACGTPPSCNETNVFGNLIATVTNITSFTVTGLTPNQIYCFGVRAMDTNGLVDANTVMRSAGPVSGTGDNDGDCLPNALEIAAGTEPCVQDTDGDGMWDGWEWTFSTNNPAKTNSISPSNPTVVYLSPIDNGVDNIRTSMPNDGDPMNHPDADPDGDGASNYEEFLWWLNHGANCAITNIAIPAGPNPTAWDTDGDGMPDGWEMINGFNPIDPSDAALDADGDGLTNLQEYQYGTDPHNTDSDGDGLTDGAEVNTYGTNPARADSDGDGLDDGYEVAIGTNPARADTDNNFLSDGDAVQLGLNPLAGTPAYNNLLFETFEATSGTRAAWTHYAVSGAGMADLWHLSTAEPAPSTGGISIAYFGDRSTSTAYRAAFDPSKSNPDATYNLGMAIAMALQSPTLSNQATTVSNLFVAWAEYYETEPSFDQTVVQVRALPDTNWINVSSVMSGMSGVTNVNATNQAARWVYRIADASQFAGRANVQVRFLFSVKNAINNDYRGWWVDDVRVYEGTAIKGWVRDNNGRAVQGATVRALGKGGVTNRIDGHRYVLPGKVFAEVKTAVDGSYSLAGLPAGNFYLKASAEGYIAEFYDGLLFTGAYAFGAGNRPGVPNREDVSVNGVISLLTLGTQTNAYFELEAGQGSPRLGVVVPNAGNLSYPTFLDGRQLQQWNGSVGAPAMVNYLSSPNIGLAPNFPDWLSNPVAPTYLSGLAPGPYNVVAGTNLPFYPQVSVDLREGESTKIIIATNQAAGRIAVRASSNRAFRISIDGRVLTNMTPSVVNVLAGTHEVTLVSTGTLGRIPLKVVNVPIGGMATANFSESEIAGAFGNLIVSAVDPFGNAITDFTILLNGQPISTNDLIGQIAGASSLTVATLRPGSHNIAVAKDGYRATPRRIISTFSGVTNSTQFVLYEADVDFDRVGDALEIEGYTNVFLYHRNNDPDADGLSNLQEFDLFRKFGVRLGVLNPDSDGDGVTDGREVGYDGHTNLYAYSTLYTNAIQNTPVVRSLFVGDYLAGVDNFGSGNGKVISIEGDRFVGDISHPLLAVPTKEPALTVFTNIAIFPSNTAVSVGHVMGAPIFADLMPHVVDTDGDGMWDGFEYYYSRATNGPMDALDNSDAGNDSDFDGLSNILEFLGMDHLANTNDWTNPGKADTDGDYMPDGWEYQYGLNPRDPADAYQDLDGDGLINLAEFLAGTSPVLRDTDADFLGDYEEVMIYGTDPLNPDTDGDGLLDGREVWDKDMDGIRDGGFFPMWNGGDLDGDGLIDGPTDWDTDGDGMPDGFEVLDNNGNIRPPNATLDPYDPTDGDEDPDGDGLSNLQEYLVRDALFGNHPTSYDRFDSAWNRHVPLLWQFPDRPFAHQQPVWDYSTDPFNADTDGDGLPDGFEVLGGLHPMDPIPAGLDSELLRYPLLGPKGDPDEDGLWNELEYKIRFQLDGSFTTNSTLGKSTHPWIFDSDGDGVADGFEHHALFGSPTEQDTDGDRLMDGIAVPGKWGEINSLRNEDYAIYSCPTCTWMDAWTIAATTPHPSDPTVFGHLAVVSDYYELQKVQALLTGSETNVALGMGDPNGVGIYGTVTGEPFVYQYFADDEPQIIPGELNVVYMRPDGFWGVADTNAIMDHFIVEWDINLATNHYDQAMNDIWELVWPLSDYISRPYWRPVQPEVSSPVPPPRWGAAMVYNPTFERKKRKFDGTTLDSRYNSEGIPVLDGRKLIVMGGVDGVDRYTDIWEFNIRSNEWRRSAESLVTPSRLSFRSQGLYSGLSDFGAVLLHGYKNTLSKRAADRYGDVPNLSRSGESFGEPKDRPWNYGFKESSYDMMYILGGWNNQNQYQLPEPMSTLWYKSTDDRDVINELSDKDDDMAAFSFTYGHTTASGTVYGVSGIRAFSTTDKQAPIGAVTRTYVTDDATTVITSTVAEVRFRRFPFLLAGDEIKYVGLRLDISKRPNTGTVFTIVGEFSQVDRSAKPFDGETPGPSLPDTVGAGADHPSTRVGTPVNSAPLDVTFTNYVSTDAYGVVTPDPGSDVLEIDVTAIALELMSNSQWNGEAIGFLLMETNGVADYALFRTESGAQRLRVEWIPDYKQPPTWRVGTRVQSENTVQIPSMRKSFAMVYAHKQNQLLLFGGMDGRQVFGDTFQARLRGGEDGDDEDDPEPLDDIDPSKGSIVKFVSWQKIPVENGPSPRWGHAMVYDEDNDDVLLFGGFDAQNRPLNDLWVYTFASVTTNYVTDTNGVTNAVETAVAGGWKEITVFLDGQKPSPRGGAMFAYFGGELYHRGIPDAYRSTKRNRFVLFGGTDGKNYYNDTWVFYRDYHSFILNQTTSDRWTLVDPGGEQSVGPSPRAFGSMVYAQNAILRPDPKGRATYTDSGDDKHSAGASVLLFGGRTGTLPAGTDTDRDLVPDGLEHELGGTAAGRDPRSNALVNPNGLETVPYNLKRLGAWNGHLAQLQRSHIADLEVLSYDERGEAWRTGLFTWQGWPIETTFTNEEYVIGDETVLPYETPDPDRLVYITGVDALSPDWTNMWYHRYPLGMGGPKDARDVWELGIPVPVTAATNSAPPYAYSGRWVYGTKLTGYYPRDAIMELYSPIFDTRAPDPQSTQPDNTNPYFLMFHEWVDLADSNDVIRVDIVRPGSPADVYTRVSGLDRPTITLIPNRNNAANTKGKWRRVIAPLNVVGNDSNLYARFTLQSDTNTLVAGGWYIDDIAVIQGSELSGLLAAGTNTEVCLIGENFNENVIDCTLSDTNGLFQFGLLPLGNYQVVAAGVTNGPYALTDGTLDVDLTMARVQFTDIAPNIGNTAAIITWSATNGAAYRLDYTTNLITGPWTFLYSVTSGVDTTLSYTDLFSTADRIYRVSITNAP